MKNKGVFLCILLSLIAFEQVMASSPRKRNKKVENNSTQAKDQYQARRLILMSQWLKGKPAKDSRDFTRFLHPVAKLLAKTRSFIIFENPGSGYRYVNQGKVIKFYYDTETTVKDLFLFISKNISSSNSASRIYKDIGLEEELFPGVSSKTLHDLDIRNNKVYLVPFQKDPNYDSDCRSLKENPGGYSLWSKYSEKLILRTKDLDFMRFAVSLNGFRIKHADPSIMNDRILILSAFNKDANALSFAPSKFKLNREMVLDKLVINPGKKSSILKFSPKEVRSDRSLLLKHFRGEDSTLQYVSRELKNDKEFCRIFIEDYPKNFQFVLKNLKNDIELALIAVKGEWETLRHASDDIRNNSEVVLAAIENDGNALQYASDNLRNNSEVVLAAVKKDGNAFQYASVELRNNSEVVLAAVKNQARALQYASEDLKNNFEFVLAVVKYQPSALEYAHYELRNNSEFVLAAIENDVRALENAPYYFKNNSEVVLAAIENDIRAIRYASDNLKNNPEVVLAAVKKNGLALQYASKDLKDNFNIVFDAVENKQSAIKFASSRLQTFFSHFQQKPE